MIRRKAEPAPEPADVTADEIAAALESELADWPSSARGDHVRAVVARADALGVPVAEDFRGARCRFTTAGARQVFEAVRDAAASVEDRRWRDLAAARELRQAELTSPALPPRELLRLGVAKSIAEGNAAPLVHAYGPGDSEFPPDGELAERVTAIANGSRDVWTR